MKLRNSETPERNFEKEKKNLILEMENIQNRKSDEIRNFHNRIENSEKELRKKYFGK